MATHDARIMGNAIAQLLGGGDSTTLPESMKAALDAAERMHFLDQRAGSLPSGEKSSARLAEVFRQQQLQQLQQRPQRPQRPQRQPRQQEQQEQQWQQREQQPLVVLDDAGSIVGMNYPLPSAMLPVAPFSGAPPIVVAESEKSNEHDTIMILTHAVVTLATVLIMQATSNQLAMRKMMR